MRRSVLILAAFVFGAAGFAQTTISFDCYSSGPLPLSSTGSCEGVVSNGLGAQTGVTGLGSCAFPTLGPKYVRLDANGPVSVLVPAGGPFPWALPQSNPPTELRVPLPVGSTTISFDWEYLNAEGQGSLFNDGMAVAVLTSSGGLVQQLAYADNQMPVGSCTNLAALATEIMPNGAQSFFGPLPPLAGCEYLSIICWNDGDNSVPGLVFVDNITFNAVAPGCPVPCFSGPPSLTFWSPSGPTCVRVDLGGLPPNGSYFLAISLVGGAYPNGWFYGIDIGFADLIAEVVFGYPFSGPTDACGSAQIGEFCGVTSGLSLYAVALGINGPILGPWSTVTPAANLIVP